jgi:pilus assembly protein Flp/PilA
MPRSPGGKKGQSLVEYALLILFMAIVVLVVVLLLGPATGNLFSNVMTNFP